VSDIVTGVTQLIQDLIAPDLKALGAKQESTGKLMTLQHDVLIKTIDAFRAEMRSELLSLRAANQLEVQRQLAPISERVAVLEAARGRH